MTTKCKTCIDFVIVQEKIVSSNDAIVDLSCKDENPKCICTYICTQVMCHRLHMYRRIIDICCLLLIEICLHKIIFSGRMCYPKYLRNAKRVTSFSWECVQIPASLKSIGIRHSYDERRLGRRYIPIGRIEWLWKISSSQVRAGIKSKVVILQTSNHSYLPKYMKFSVKSWRAFLFVSFSFVSSRDMKTSKRSYVGRMKGWKRYHVKLGISEIWTKT